MVDTDAVPELGDSLPIRSIPSLAVRRQDREISRVAGARPAAEIEAIVVRV